jgi:hypothetical protein
MRLSKSRKTEEKQAKTTNKIFMCSAVFTSAPLPHLAYKFHTVYYINSIELLHNMFTQHTT